jgi:high affinity Mn2+ porin
MLPASPNGRLPSCGAGTLRSLLGAAVLAGMICLAATGPAAAQDAPAGSGIPPQAQDLPPQEDWNAHFQSTYIWQHQSAFDSPYSGTNSLPAHPENAYTFSFTAAFGKRLWQGGELYFDPEVVQGVPFSGNLIGMGGFYNGEITRAAGPHLVAYRARLFMRQTWGRGGGRETVESDMNQLGGAVDRDRIVLTAGFFSALDIFDNNKYAHDPRTQFMNWCNMTSCAFDYAADARGYSWGLALEDYSGDWAYRFGQFMEPKDPNILALDWQYFRHYGQNFEIEHAHVLLGQPGKVRLLAYRNAVNTGSFADAMASPNFAADNAAGIPATGTVRKAAVKYGAGYNIEQAITDDIGLFFRAMWQDGHYETFAFTEAHRSLELGAAVSGGRWSRERDTVGVSYMRNALSGIYRQYLAAGGLGYFIGDGRINYGDEQIVEAYYSIGVARDVSLTADYQYFRNPAYNAARGPLSIAGARLHWEY